jgi:4-amino-4-deoxy-L-arabinose transferase-like glycosyltransferase
MKTLSRFLWGSTVVLALAGLLILASVIFMFAGGAGLPDVLPLLGGLGVLSGACVALVALLLNLARARSRDYLDNCLDLLERAFQVLTQGDASTAPPNRRENWIAAARFLKASEALSKEILETSHRRVYEERLLDWRLRFHNLLQPNDDGFPETYFAEHPDDVFVWGRNTRAPLDTRSIAVLYRFLRFPPGYADPLLSEPLFSPQEIHQMKTFGPRALGRFLEKVQLSRESGHTIRPNVFKFEPEQPDDDTTTRV